MYAHPFLTFPMPENIPADLRYPLFAHINQKQCDYVESTPTDLMELVKLIVCDDDEGLITSAVESSAEANDDFITVGFSLHFPHLYFLQSSTTRRKALWEQFIREELIINLYNMWEYEANAFDTLFHIDNFPHKPLACFVHKDKNSVARIITTDGGDGGHSDVCFVAYENGSIYIGHKENDVCSRYPIASITADYGCIHSAFERMLMRGEGAEVVPNTKPLTRLYAQLDAYDSELEESDKIRELWYITPNVEDCDLENTVTFGYHIDEDYIYMTALDEESDKDPTQLHRFSITRLCPPKPNPTPSWLTR